VKTRTCPRLFEAEAMRDGRLAGAERASFERHAQSCSACAREVEALEALGTALRASTPEPTDALRVRRERTRLLAAFDRDLLAPARPGGPSRWLGFAAAAALGVAVVLVLWRERHVRDARQTIAASGAVVRAEGSAAWTERLEGDRDLVTLERGALRIHVDHAAGTRRLVVLLPDGELEDTGTTFTVIADDGHTRRVAVEDGSVVLRLHGLPPVFVGAGDVWRPTAPPPASVASAPSSVAAIPAPAPSQPAPSAVTPHASGLASDPSADFRQAMSALDHGDNGHAAAGFARFLADHPRDARAEDAAYLRIIALQRSGDDGNTREAALDYLRRYPTGFRRAEVETLLR
jgi:anti-sigma factor RsiW